MYRVPLFGIPMGPELLLIILLVALLFGANRLPDFGRSIGEALGQFEQGKQEIESELDEVEEEFQEVGQEIEEVKKDVETDLKHSQQDSNRRGTDPSNAEQK